MHQHQNADSADRFTMDQNPQIRYPKNERHQDGQSEEQPARLRGDSGDGWLADTGDRHSDQGQLPEVGHLEVHEASRGGEDRRPDSDEDRFRDERTHVCHDQGSTQRAQAGGSW